MKKLVLVLLVISCSLFAQGPGFATNPTPQENTFGTSWFNIPLSWTNPSSTTSIKINVGIHPDYLTELYSGLVINSFVLPSPLDVRRTYYWRIDELDNSGTTIGNVWTFTTSITLYPVFIDSFNLGMNNWNVTNFTDSCNWQWENFNGLSYDLPPTSNTYGIVFDKHNCQNQRSINILELANPPSLVGFTRCGVGWDSDLYLNGLNDTAYVEVSEDGGLSWNKIWGRYGRSQRKSQEEIFLGFHWNWDIRVRLYSSFESSTSWWAIDNFYINAHLTSFVGKCAVAEAYNFYIYIFA
jgi:hypothetical protein